MWRYWQFTEDGDLPGRARWELDPSWSIETKWRFREGQPITDWLLADAEVRCEPTDLHEDMPFSLDDTMIVSDRFRELLEREVSGDIQFLPVRMVGPGAKGLKHDYWILNTLKEIECLDKARSMNECDDGEGPFVEMPVIDPAKIPPDVRLCRIKEYRVIALIREDLKQVIEDAGITGPGYYGIWHSSDPGAPPPIWKPGVNRW